MLLCFWQSYGTFCGILRAPPPYIAYTNKLTNPVSRAVYSNTSREAGEVLDEELRSIVKTRPPRSSGPRRAHQRGRMDNLRRDKGQQAEIELSKALQNKLYPGVKSEQST